MFVIVGKSKETVMHKYQNRTRRGPAFRTRLGWAVIGYFCFVALTLPVAYANTLQQAYLKASNTSAGDNFGWAVAIDGNTAVVGAREAGNDLTLMTSLSSSKFGNGTGAAYVFIRSGGSWSLQATLKASNAEPGDTFGHSVDIFGDTLVVSAESEESSATGVNGDQSDNSVPHAGAVYVFVRDGTSWSQQAYLKASNTDDRDQFGHGVAISGNTVAVTAACESSDAIGINGDPTNNSSHCRGAVYVFTRNGTSWSQQAYIKASNSDNGGSFGMSPGLSIDGDTLVAGAGYEPSNATGVNGDQNNKSAPGAGAVYVFTRNGTTWSQQAYIKASNTDNEDLFGRSVALSGDSLVVGAWREDSSAKGVDGDQSDNFTSGAGAAYLFTRNGTVWTQQDYLKASNTEADDNFGNAVAISGNTVVVAAIVEDSSARGVNGDQSDNSAENSGAAYVFDTTQGFSINAGHAGAWVNPETSGQGQFIDVEPETQFMFVSWFTFTDAASGHPFEQRWLTAQGNYSGNTAELNLWETLGGRFDDPQEVTRSRIGEVTLSFSDCEQGLMSYNIDEEELTRRVSPEPGDRRFRQRL